MTVNYLLFLIIGFLTLSKPLAVTIEIKELKNSKGQILLELSDADKNVLKGYTHEIQNGQCIITLDGLKPGKYAFKYFHDENSNKKLDTNLIGIPKEGFGFSNNAKGKFGPPSFEKMIFKINSDTIMICKPMYIGKK